ncbi:MAG: HesA/MoeB/ThiF family protein [Alphaproteobacteria bacterium]|nr:HesA/MoeB/ThiF family protein [Alphaproteobacteria bacterium]
MIKTDRYARQIVLPEIGEAGQDRLARASVLCVGAGGLGCPALLYLAAAGVGRIGVIDADTVDLSNLQRQVLFSTAQVGENKALAAAERLRHLNPEIQVEAYPERLTAENSVKLFPAYDLIIDGTDNFSSKFLINDASLACGVPFIYASILGFEGQIGVFGLEDGPCYRCLFPHAPEGDVPTCAQAGVIGALAGMMGAMQAMEAVKIIVGHERFAPLSGKLWTIDARDMAPRVLSLPRSPDCPICHETKEHIMFGLFQNSSPRVPDLSPVEARSHSGALFVDVREANEWDAGHIEGAQHFALSRLLQGQTPDWPKDREIILYCAHGQRSLQAAKILQKQDYTNLSNMAGGYAAWCSAR